MTNTTSVSELRKPPAPAIQPDTRVDMFSMQGFALAQRIANAFASSDAVPAQFRTHTLKKSKSGDQWVENPAALGNCIVAIEVAQAVGMSITAVMQNADVIEGKLRWTGKFVIAAINASRRFTPLEFEIKNLGTMKAKYKEKLGWNDQKRGFDFADREVEIENLQCTAFAFALENGKPTSRRIEGVPVSIKMAVEEGWYSKPGSKWQTELKHLMLQYRAGTFFGNIHAPDIVMGMGRTAEEERDIIEVRQQDDGTYAANLDELKAGPAAEAKPANPAAETVVVKAEEPETGAGQGDGAAQPDDNSEPPAPAEAAKPAARRVRPPMDVD